MVQQSGTEEWLKGVWGRSETEVFAVGYAGTILQYDGFTWSPMVSGTTANLRGVWGDAQDEIYAVGNSGTIVKYNGEAWFDEASATDVDLYAIWGSSGTDVYAVGAEGTILHYNGESWSGVASGIGVDLFGIWGSSETDVYVVGAEGTILRYDGVLGQKCVLENLYGGDSVKLAAFRNFRDDVLSTSLQGKLTISTYYILSPYLVKLIKNNLWVRSSFEKSIDVFLPSLGVVND